MGGLVAAQLIARHGKGREIGRVVMLAPPNQGSEIADALSALPPYHWIYGPAGQQLVTARTTQPPPDYALGIIAGSYGNPYLLGRMLIRGAHDGRVSVERTRQPGMRDHLTVSASHSFIMRKPIVHRQVLAFLAHGQFDRVAT
ncbi:hypothetical protein [Devosia sp.]|uniref:hypothetical protein n=1 Tax=Devosia sp. TaxID=1871048 RepID=UPI003A927AC2